MCGAVSAMKLIRPLLVLSTCSLAFSVVQGAIPANGPEFSALCDIYNLVAQVEGFSTTKEPPRRPDPIMDELRLLNASVADQVYYDTGNSSQNRQEGSEKGVDLSWAATRQRINQNIKSSGRKPLDGRVPDLAATGGLRHEIKQLADEGEIALEAYKDTETRMTHELASAKQEALRAVFGDGKPSWDKTRLEDKTFTGASGGSVGGESGGSGLGCGNTGSNAAGLNIISDITCICVGRQSGSRSASNNICVNGLASLENGALGATALAGASGWQSVEPKCVARAIPVLGNPSHQLRSALAVFLAQIGREAEHTLGGTASVTGCGAGTAATNLCVHYGNYKSSGYKTIPWVKELLAAIQNLEAAEATTRELQMRWAELTAINRTAWAVYEGRSRAFLLRQVGSSSGNSSDESTTPNPATTTKKTTAQEPTAANQAVYPRFISLWVLLI